MHNLAETYQYIADILSFKTLNSDLEKTLSDKDFNWDAIVIEGSKHLILPAIYCRLKEKELIHVLPSELNTYLKEITSINRNRNNSIIKQAIKISELFKENDIDHVFLKGTALITSNFYKDIAERMLGDIDILICKNHIGKALKLVKSLGYTSAKTTIANDFFKHRHLPRLMPESDMCAIELHQTLFTNFKNIGLTTEHILKDKNVDSVINIPSQEHLLLHNVLNHQINDNGKLYKSINLRSAYDTIYLFNTGDLSTTWADNKVFMSYYNLVSLFFNDLKTKVNPKKNLTTKFYLFKLNHLRFYKFWNKILKLSNYFWVIIGRTIYFMTNTAYRKAVIKDRKRIYKHFTSILNNS